MKEETMTETLPPDPENQNHDRAKWAESALLAFQNEIGTDDEDALADLLCDLRHLADRKGWHFEAEMERAQAHYVAETAPDQPALLAAAQLVLDRWSSGDLAEAVRMLDAAVSDAKGGMS
jgi:hypothetical protein